MIIIFELTILLFCVSFFFRVFRKRMFGILLIGLTGLVFVSAGEIMNRYFTGVTSYNDGYIFWVPRTGIPLFILVGGAFMSVFIFIIAQLLAIKYSIKKLSRSLRCAIFIFMLSVFLPFFEIFGIKAGLWRWNKPFSYDILWFLGVWMFYFVFVVIPSLIGILIFKRLHGPAPERSQHMKNIR